MHILLIAAIVLGVIAAFFFIGFANLARHRMRRYGWASGKALIFTNETAVTRNLHYV